MTESMVFALSLIVFVAALSQRTVGFGFSLVAVPLFAFVVPTKSAVIIALLLGPLSSTWMAIHLRNATVRPATIRLTGAALLGIPFGIAVLSFLSQSDLRLLLGFFTCAGALWLIWQARFLAFNEGKVRHPASTYLMGFLSGVLNTALATNGPPLVYELRREGLSGDPFRATLSTVFTITSAVSIPLLVASGLVHLIDFWLFLTAIPATIIGTVLGTALGSRLKGAAFLWVVDLLLLATGALTITRALS